MRHKIITIDITERNGRKSPAIPYTGTGVGLNQSIGQIKDLLTRHGCNRIIDANESGKDYPMHTVAFEKDGLRYLIDFPITYTKNSLGRKLNMDVSGRIVYNKVKSLLVDAEIGHLSFMEAMLPYLALPTPEGPKSVLEVIESQTEQIKAGTQGLLQLPGGGP